MKMSQRARVFPPLSFIHYNARLLDLLERGKLNEQTIQPFLQERDRIQKLMLRYMTR